MKVWHNWSLNLQVKIFRTIVGPAVGSFLYQSGGFKLPFIAVGAFGLVFAVLLTFSIPKVDKNPPRTSEEDPKEDTHLLDKNRNEDSKSDKKVLTVSGVAK